MTIRQYLTFMFIGTLLCWLAFGLVIFNVDPFQSDGVGFAFFYASLFLASLGTFSLVLLASFYLIGRGSKPLFVYVQKSFYYACLLALTVIILLYLQASQLLSIWNLVIVIIIFVLLVLFIISLRSSRHPS